jgi:hypothetical protein
MIARKAAKRRRRCDGGFVISTLTSPTRFTKERIMVRAAIVVAGTLNGIIFIASYIAIC